MITFMLALVIAALHIWILVMEMFLWCTPRVRKVFGTTEEFAAATRVLAGNQGLYNGFLAAGLVFGLARGEVGRPDVAFFLACVVVAGLYGAATANRRILFVQAVPAALALAALALRI
ncbi:MAG: DUF1304 domain-containing protein [Siculibacillus sp.]|nr:DUF1304 domain-containing protein [Siculibacillus sp.]